LKWPACRTRRAISDGKFASIIAVLVLVVIIVGVGASSVLAAQQSKINNLQDQLSTGTGLLACPQITYNGFTGQANVPLTGKTDKFTLIMENATIPMNANSTWHAWTYNGTVPGPTLHIQLGDQVQVHVINHLNLVHSWHMHYVGYNFSDDGSPANVIMGIGAGAMISPGGQYTYNFTALSPGLFYYHDHAATAQYGVMYMVAQGLYGTMIVDDECTPTLAHDWPIMMGEIGAQVNGTDAPYYIMDGKGFNGGEGGLEQLFAKGGFSAIQAQINTTLLTFTMKVGQVARLDLINIGDETHTFHLHDIAMIGEWNNAGVAFPAEVVPLDPGVAQAVIIQPTQPGLWLFHCHVLGHEDISMVGALLVTS